MNETQNPPEGDTTVKYKAMLVLRDYLEPRGLNNIYRSWHNQAMNPASAIHHDKPGDAITDSTIFRFWTETEEKETFWRNVFNAIIAGDLPKLKELNSSGVLYNPQAKAKYNPDTVSSKERRQIALKMFDRTRYGDLQYVDDEVLDKAVKDAFYLADKFIEQSFKK